METVAQWVPVVSFFVAALSLHSAACVALYALRARRLPRLDPLYALGISGVILWFASQLAGGNLAWALLFGAAFGAFLAAEFATNDLRALHVAQQTEASAANHR